jgi:hypothetical protein
LAPGYGISFFRIQPIFIGAKKRYFGLKILGSDLFLYMFKKLDNFQFCEIYGHLFFCWIRDPGWKKNPDPGRPTGDKILMDPGRRL